MKTKQPKQALTTTENPCYGSRIIGKHINCGGEVMYTFTPSRGHSSCIKCGQNSIRNAAPDVEKE